MAAVGDLHAQVHDIRPVQVPASEEEVAAREASVVIHRPHEVTIRVRLGQEGELGVLVWVQRDVINGGLDGRHPEVFHLRS